MYPIEGMTLRYAETYTYEEMKVIYNEIKEGLREGTAEDLTFLSSMMMFPKRIPDKRVKTVLDDDQKPEFFSQFSFAQLEGFAWVLGLPEGVKQDYDVAESLRLAKYYIDEWFDLYDLSDRLAFMKKEQYVMPVAKQLEKLDPTITVENAIEEIGESESIYQLFAPGVEVKMNGLNCMVYVGSLYECLPDEIADDLACRGIAIRGDGEYNISYLKVKRGLYPACPLEVCGRYYLWYCDDGDWYLGKLSRNPGNRVQYHQGVLYVEDDDSPISLNDIKLDIVIESGFIPQERDDNERYLLGIDGLEYYLDYDDYNHQKIFDRMWDRKLCEYDVALDFFPSNVDLYLRGANAIKQCEEIYLKFGHTKFTSGLCRRWITLADSPTYDDSSQQTITDVLDSLISDCSNWHEIVRELRKLGIRHESRALLDEVMDYHNFRGSSVSGIMEGVYSEFSMPPFLDNLLVNEFDDNGLDPHFMGRYLKSLKEIVKNLSDYDYSKWLEFLANRYTRWTGFTYKQVFDNFVRNPRSICYYHELNANYAKSDFTMSERFVQFSSYNKKFNKIGASVCFACNEFYKPRVCNNKFYETLCDSCLNYCVCMETDNDLVIVHGRVIPEMIFSEERLTDHDYAEMCRVFSMG